MPVINNTACNYLKGHTQTSCGGDDRDVATSDQLRLLAVGRRDTVVLGSVVR